MTAALCRKRAEEANTLLRMQQISITTRQSCMQAKGAQNLTHMSSLACWIATKAGWQTTRLYSVTECNISSSKHLSAGYQAPI